MSKFTSVQKAAFHALAKKYDPAVLKIVSRDDDIYVINRQEATLLDEFANNICSWVIRDHPDHTGRDEDINADAEKVTFMIANILDEAGFGS